MAKRLPIVTAPRALVPGTTMILTASEEAVGTGDRIVVLFVDPSYGRARVGTESLIEGRRDDLTTRLRVAGERLVWVDHDDEESTEIRLVAGEGPRAGLVEEVGQALRRYMAVRAESGLGGDIHVELAPDPEEASHQVASLLHVTWPEIQEVLEAGGTGARLERSLQVLHRETVLLSATMTKRE